MAEKTLNARFKNKYDTAKNWTDNNPVLLAGEIGIESDTGFIKIGNGTDNWETLEYLSVKDVKSIINNVIKIKNGNSGFSAGENSQAYCGGAVGFNSYATNGGAMGINSTSGDGGAIGANSSAGVGFAGGYKAKEINNCVQLGEGSNTKTKTLQIYDDNIYDSQSHTLTVQNAKVNNKDVAIKEDIPTTYIKNATKSADGKTLTITKQDDTSFDFSGGSSSVTVDSELSDTSTNPVQNKVINNALKVKKDINALTTKTKLKNTWISKTWNGLNTFGKIGIWTDGVDIYSSEYDKQYVLDKSTSTWNPKTWNGLTEIQGENIWTDGENIYFSQGLKHYVLDRATSTWNPKTWNGHSDFQGKGIWTDGENIYYSDGEYGQYVLDKSAVNCEPEISLNYISRNNVNLTSNQIINGDKTFNGIITVRDVDIY